MSENMFMLRRIGAILFLIFAGLLLKETFGLTFGQMVAIFIAKLAYSYVGFIIED